MGDAFKSGFQEDGEDRWPTRRPAPAPDSAVMLSARWQSSVHLGALGPIVVAAANTATTHTSAEQVDPVRRGPATAASAGTSDGAGPQATTEYALRLVAAVPPDSERFTGRVAGAANRPVGAGSRGEDVPPAPPRRNGEPGRAAATGGVAAMTDASTADGDGSDWRPSP